MFCQHCQATYSTVTELDRIVCVRCRREVQAQVAPNLDPAMQAQVSAALQMLQSLAHGAALPLVTLLTTWWDQLDDERKKVFLDGLVERAVRVVANGYLDKELGEALGNYFHSASFAEAQGPMMARADVQAAIAEKVNELLEASLDPKSHKGITCNSRTAEYLNKHLPREASEVVRRAAKVELDARAESVAAEVDKRLPSVAELADKVVGKAVTAFVNEAAKKAVRDVQEPDEEG